MLTRWTTRSPTIPSTATETAERCAMDVSIVIPAEPLQVVPGEKETWVVEISNDGPAVSAHLEASGRAGDWVALGAAVVPLGSGERRKVRLDVRAPVDGWEVGAVVPVVLRAVDDDRIALASAAGVFVVAPRARVSGRIDKLRGSFLRSATLPVVLTNDGREGVVAALRATGTCVCEVVPVEVEVGAESVVQAQLRVHAPMLWWGDDCRHDVEVGWSTPGGGGVAATVVLQRALLTAAGLVAVVVTVAVAVVVWLVVRRATS
jgi:hypothetical protein